MLMYRCNKNIHVDIIIERPQNLNSLYGGPSLSPHSTKALWSVSCKVPPRIHLRFFLVPGRHAPRPPRRMSQTIMLPPKTILTMQFNTTHLLQLWIGVNYSALQYKNHITEIGCHRSRAGLHQRREEMEQLQPQLFGWFCNLL